MFSKLSGALYHFLLLLSLLAIPNLKQLPQTTLSNFYPTYIMMVLALITLKNWTYQYTVFRFWLPHLHKLLFLQSSFSFHLATVSKVFRARPLNWFTSCGTHCASWMCSSPSYNIYLSSKLDLFLQQINMLRSPPC